MSDDVVQRSPTAKDTDQMEVVLVRIADGSRVVCLPSWKSHYTWEDEYWWTEGNQGCAGNRRDEWADQHDIARPEEHTCDGRDFYVILRTPGWTESVLGT